MQCEEIGHAQAAGTEVGSIRRTLRPWRDIDPQAAEDDFDYRVGRIPSRLEMASRRERERAALRLLRVFNKWLRWRWTDEWQEGFPYLSHMAPELARAFHRETGCPLDSAAGYFHRREAMLRWRAMLGREPGIREGAQSGARFFWAAVRLPD